MSHDNPRSRPDLFSQPLADGSTVVFDPHTGTAHELNPVGALIWEYCDGEHSIEAIAAELHECFGVALHDGRRDVQCFVDGLRQLALLAVEAVA